MRPKMPPWEVLLGRLAEPPSGRPRPGNGRSAQNVCESRDEAGGQRLAGVEAPGQAAQIDPGEAAITLAASCFGMMLPSKPRESLGGGGVANGMSE
jgi:hypothetical protein